LCKIYQSVPYHYLKFGPLWDPTHACAGAENRFKAGRKHWKLYPSSLLLRWPVYKRHSYTVPKQPSPPLFCLEQSSNKYTFAPLINRHKFADCNSLSTILLGVGKRIRDSNPQKDDRQEKICRRIDNLKNNPIHICKRHEFCQWYLNFLNLNKKY